jgi:hypothetical protein
VSLAASSRPKTVLRVYPLRTRPSVAAATAERLFRPGRCSSARDQVVRGTPDPRTTERLTFPQLENAGDDVGWWSRIGFQRQIGKVLERQTSGITTPSTDTFCNCTSWCVRLRRIARIRRRKSSAAHRASQSRCRQFAQLATKNAKVSICCIRRSCLDSRYWVLWQLRSGRRLGTNRGISISGDRGAVARFKRNMAAQATAGV